MPVDTAGSRVDALCPGRTGARLVRTTGADPTGTQIIPQIPAGPIGPPKASMRHDAFRASGDAGLNSGSTISANGAQFSS